MKRVTALAAIVASLAFAACGDDEESATSAGSGSETSGSSAGTITPNDANKSKTVTIGSKNFTEQFILGEIYAQALEAAGYTVKKELNLGSEQIALRAVKRGQVDAYPEYTGTALTSFFKKKATEVPRDEAQAYQQAKDGFAAEGLTALPATPFTDSNGVGMLKTKAEELGIKTLSDLAKQSSGLTLYGPPECRQRPDCLLGLQDVYKAKFKKFVPIDPGLRHQVLDKGQADAAIVFTTDGQLAQGKELLLEDDQSMFPPYNVTLVFNSEKLKELGADAQKAIELVQKGLTTEAMQELNSRVDIDKQTPKQVAADYLKESGYIK